MTAGVRRSADYKETIGTTNNRQQVNITILGCETYFRQNEAKKSNDFNNRMFDAGFSIASLGPAPLDCRPATTRPMLQLPERSSGVEEPMRRVIAFSLLAAASMPVGYVHAQSTDDSLRLYAVNIVQDPPQPWTGYGIYLGKGLVITAAHVVGLFRQTKPSVHIAGRDLPARPIREGNLERVDLTLLSIDEHKLPIYLQMRRLLLCDNQPWPGEPVIVAIPEGTARSHIVSPAFFSLEVQKRFPTLIADVATTGNSGSGVFDAGQKCLLGIMSRKITARVSSTVARPELKDGEQRDLAKYFVPASTIRAFMPAEHRF